MPSASHDDWLTEVIAEKWIYGFFPEIWIYGCFSGTGLTGAEITHHASLQFTFSNVTIILILRITKLPRFSWRRCDTGVWGSTESLDIVGLNDPVERPHYQHDEGEEGQEAHCVKHEGVGVCIWGNEDLSLGSEQVRNKQSLSVTFLHILIIMKSGIWLNSNTNILNLKYTSKIKVDIASLISLTQHSLTVACKDWVIERKGLKSILIRIHVWLFCGIVVVGGNFPMSSAGRSEPEWVSLLAIF